MREAAGNPWWVDCLKVFVPGGMLPAPNKGVLPYRIGAVEAVLWLIKERFDCCVFTGVFSGVRQMRCDLHRF